MNLRFETRKAPAWI